MTKQAHCDLKGLRHCYVVGVKSLTQRTSAFGGRVVLEVYRCEVSSPVEDSCTTSQ